MVATAAVAYVPRDVFLLRFIGIVVAASLGPWHVGHRHWGTDEALGIPDLHFS